MTDLATILNPGREILRAWEAILKVAIENVYPARSDETKITPYVDIQIASIMNNGRQQPYKDWKIYVGWKMTLATKVATSRGINTDDHSKMVDHVMENMGQFFLCFGPSKLPAHLVQDCRLSGYSESVGGANEGLNDFTEIRHDLEVNIRDNVLEG